jgi:hypothetical protein
VLAVPENLTLISHSMNPDSGNELGYLINWSAVEGADYYQLDRSTGDSTKTTNQISWSPAYTGKPTFPRMYFSKNQFEGLRVRVVIVIE